MSLDCLLAAIPPSFYFEEKVSPTLILLFISHYCKNTSDIISVSIPFAAHSNEEEDHQRRSGEGHYFNVSHYTEDTGSNSYQKM